MYKGKAIRYFPYSKYILCKGDLEDRLFYGINHTIYKLFRIHKFTKSFRSLEELENCMKSKGYKISQ